MCGCGCGKKGPDGVVIRSGNTQFTEDVDFAAAGSGEDAAGPDNFYNEFKGRKTMFWVSILTLIVGVLSLARG